VLAPGAVVRTAVASEVAPGHALAAPVPLPCADGGPFGLGPGFAFLERVCVDRTLAITPVTLPILIHASDLRRIAVRWLELMAIIRCEAAAAEAAHADVVAYPIAAAETKVPHGLGGNSL